MQTIVNNTDNLEIKDIDQMTCKVRGIILEDDKIVFSKYADVFMLVGGKVDDGETNIEALKREIREETGAIISEDATPFIRIESYLKNYYDRKKRKYINRLTITTYYFVNIVKFTDKNLTDSECQLGLSVYKMDIDELRDLVVNYLSTNEKYDIFKNELLQVLDSIKKSEFKLRRSYE